MLANLVIRFLFDVDRSVVVVGVCKAMLESLYPGFNDD